MSNKVLKYKYIKQIRSKKSLKKNELNLYGLIILF